jgi:hypothetical protein
MTQYHSYFCIKFARFHRKSSSFSVERKVMVWLLISVISAGTSLHYGIMKINGGDNRTKKNNEEEGQEKDKYYENFRK